MWHRRCAGLRLATPTRRALPRRICLAVGLALSPILGIVAWSPGTHAQAGIAPRGTLGAIAKDVEHAPPSHLLLRLERLPARVREGVRTRFLRAHLLAATGELGAAADALPLDADALPEAVRAQARRDRAVWLARAGRCSEAEPLLADWANAEPLMRARLGECALARGAYARAAALLERVPQGRADIDDVAVRLGLARAYEGQGRADAARGVLRELVAERPEHPEGEAVLAAYQALGGELDADLRLRRAARWTRIGRAPRALAELEPLEVGRGDPGWARYQHAYGMALFRTRKRYPEAAKVLARSARVASPTQLEDAFHAARALSRAGDNRGAIRAYRTFARRHRGHGRAVQAEFLAAWLAMRDGHEIGERWMERFVSGPSGKRSPSRRQDGLWQLAFGAFEDRRFASAEQRFLRYAETSAHAMVRARGLYWAGRAALARRRKAQAVRHFEAAMQVEPLHWYALLAGQRLAELGQPRHPFGGEGVSPAQRDEPTEGDLTLPEEVRFYARLGLRRLALEALARQEAAVARAAADGEGMSRVVRAYRALGEHRRPYMLVRSRMRDVWGRPPDADTRWIWEASYARPYPEDVSVAAREHGVPQTLLYAVMRKESAFDPDVVSYADAVGLMQLIPPTARQLSKAMGEPYSRERLFEPAWNIRLGGRLLGRLLEAFDGQVPLAVAAYNAGSHRVRGWLERDRELELDRFVERIPIEQTRNYVRRVTTSWARYLYLSDPTTDYTELLAKRLHRNVVQLANGL